MPGPSLNDIRQAMRSHRICVLIPTYNNAGTLRDVVASVLEYSPDVIVVNDGSTDSTPDILKQFGDSIDIVSYDKNRGKGGALKAGFRRALQRGFDYAITIDSDGQHYASDIPAFVKAIIEYPGALIVGERDLSGVDIKSGSSFANKFSNFWFTLQTGRRLKDTQTGYRAYPLHRLHGLSLLTSRYEAELELLVFASWNGVSIKAIPINVYYPPRAERVSHFKPALDFTRISLLNTILCVAAIVYGIPARIYNAIAQKRIFNCEFKPFTRRKGVQKEAATTLGRLGRSLFGGAFFAFFAFVIFTPCSLLFFSVGRNTERKKLRFHKMLQRISRFLTRNFPGAKVVYENASNEDFSKPALVICNHQSHLDLPVLMAVNPKLIFLTNERVWDNPFYGKIIHRAEYLPVSEGMDTILPKLRDLVSRGYSIVVFPEGTRSADCSIQRFHQGAFHIANELKLDIVPMVLHGAGHYLPKNDFMLRRGRITLRIMERIPFTPDAFATLREEASHYRKLITGEYNRMAAEIETPEYFKSLIKYKYSWRGWRITALRKKHLPSAINSLSTPNSLDSPSSLNFLNSLDSLNSFHSTNPLLPLLAALVYKDTEIHAYIESLEEYNIAISTPALPPNLHYHHTPFPPNPSK